MYYWYVTAFNPNGESPAPLAIRSFTVQINPDFGGDGTLYGGYYFANSTVDGGGFGYQPTFDWIDISTTGTTFSLSIDGLQTAIPIGFTFNHFGVNYTELTVAANGTVQFTGFDSDWDSAGNLFIPDAATPNDLIALIAMDCDPSQIPTLFYYDNDADGNFVFSAYMWNDYSDIAEFVDVQMILYPSGRIKIQYQNYMNPYGDTGLNSILGDACIGIENADGTIGHQYRNNGDGGPMLEDMALCYAMTAEGLAEPVAGLDAPTNLVLTYDLGLMNLVWDSVPGATMYNVYAGETPDFAVEPASFFSSWPTNSAVMDPSLLPGNHYFVKVTADDTVLRNNEYRPSRRSYRTYGWVEYIEPVIVPEKAKK